MFSFIKVLNICENNITVRLHGNYGNNKKLIKKINYLFMGDATIIHNESDDDFFAIICKNQTCSKKLKDFKEINKYLENLKNV